MRTVNLIGAHSTKVTLATGTRNPLYTRTITDLPTIIHALTDGYDVTGSFMAGYAFADVLHADAKVFPFVAKKRLVGAAEACPCDLDEDLAWAWLGDVDGLDGGFCIWSDALTDCSALLRGYRHYDGTCLGKIEVLSSNLVSNLRFEKQRSWIVSRASNGS
jgi:hypothetical protein